MNGRVSKKLNKEARRVAEVNVYKAYIGFVQSVMRLPFRKRLKFCFSVLFRREYRAPEERK